MKKDLTLKQHRIDSNRYWSPNDEQMMGIVKLLNGDMIHGVGARARAQDTVVHSMLDSEVGLWTSDLTLTWELFCYKLFFVCVYTIKRS